MRMESRSKKYKKFKIWWNWILKRLFVDYHYNDVFVQMCCDYIIYRDEVYIKFKKLKFYEL